jgi:hypothetical protein
LIFGVQKSGFERASDKVAITTNSMRNQKQQGCRNQPGGEFTASGLEFQDKSKGFASRSRPVMRDEVPPPHRFMLKGDVLRRAVFGNDGNAEIAPRLEMTLSKVCYLCGLAPAVTITI